MPENPASYRVVRTKSYLFNKAIMNYHGGQLTRPPLRRQHATSTGPVPRRHRRQFFAPGQHQTGASAAG
ncbi:TPA: lactonase family protein [Klebsiella pneumoniae]|nr:lactonase family protein [Klebsiella pneumoniae]HBZ3553073.1 lactonase family protein [Klebsiella pneumoniae]